VLQAGNGGEALECQEQANGRVGLVLSDVVMPGLGGPKFAGRLAERYPALPVIWMSGYPQEVFAGKELSEGSWFLQKPIHPDRLTATVARVLHRSTSASPVATDARSSGRSTPHRPSRRARYVSSRRA
jgi:two-component system, cell cycle sensor histidine kinase and response regulator CckA